MTEYCGTTSFERFNLNLRDARGRTHSLGRQDVKIMTITLLGASRLTVLELCEALYKLEWRTPGQKYLSSTSTWLYIYIYKKKKFNEGSFVINGSRSWVYCFTSLRCDSALGGSEEKISFWSVKQQQEETA